MPLDDTNTATGSTDTDTATAPEAVASPPEALTSLDDLLNAPDDVLPTKEDGSNHSGLKPLAGWLHHLPEDVRKHLSNLRADYTRKTQSLAQERDSIRAELEAERQALQAEREALYNGETAKRAKQLSEDTTEYDMYDPEQLKKELERQAAKQYQSMIAPLQEQLEQQKAEQQAKAFISAHPDLQDPDMKKEVAAILISREDINLEDAYYIAKGKVSSLRASALVEQEAKLRAEQEALKAKQRQSFSKTSTGTPGSNRPAHGARNADETWAIYERAKAESERKRR